MGNPFFTYDKIEEIKGIIHIVRTHQGEGGSSPKHKLFIKSTMYPIQNAYWGGTGAGGRVFNIFAFCVHIIIMWMTPSIIVDCSYDLNSMFIYCYINMNSMFAG